MNAYISSSKVIWDHKVTNLKAIHNEDFFEDDVDMLFEITKLRIWKQFTTNFTRCNGVYLLFEVTKLRIWKQLTTPRICEMVWPPLFEVTKLRIWKQLTTKRKFRVSHRELFEVTKLRIWKQLTTPRFSVLALRCCLRSQSYEFKKQLQKNYVRNTWYLT